MRRPVKSVSPAAKLIGDRAAYREPRLPLQKPAEQAETAAFKIAFTQFGESVSVPADRRAAHSAVVQIGGEAPGQNRHLRGSAKLALGPAFVPGGDRIQTEMVLCGFAADQVDDARHGAGSVKSRVASLNDFDLLDEARRDLFQPVDGRHPRIAWQTIFQNLRIGTFQAADPQLHETAVLAVHFHPDPRNGGLKGFRKRCFHLPVYGLGSENVGPDWRLVHKALGGGIRTCAGASAQAASKNRRTDVRNILSYRPMPIPPLSTR